MRLGTIGFIQLFPKRRNSIRTYSILFSLLISFLIIASSAWASKPRPPLQLSLHRTEISKEISRVTLITTAHLDFSRVEVVVELSSGLSLIKGEEKWEGPLKKGESHKRELMIENPGHMPREVTGKAIIHLDEGGGVYSESDDHPQWGNPIITTVAAIPPRVAPRRKKMSGTDLPLFKSFIRRW